MTTIIATKDKILSDGKVTVGGRVDSLNFCKVRNIGNYLVGGAGRATSVAKFFDWWAHKVSVEQANAFDPNLGITVLPDERDEDFQAIVVTPTGEMYYYEGNDITRALPIEEEFYSIGSGSDYALAALHAGVSPEKAMEVAKDLDCYSGGTTFIETHIVWEDLPETREQANEYTKEQLIDMMFGKEEVIEEDEQAVDQYTQKSLGEDSTELENHPAPIHIQSFPVSPEENLVGCNHKFVFAMSIAYQSFPVKYKGICENCGEIVYETDRGINILNRKGKTQNFCKNGQINPSTYYTEEQSEMIMMGWSVNTGEQPVGDGVSVKYILKDGVSGEWDAKDLDWNMSDEDWNIAYWQLADE